MDVLFNSIKETDRLRKKLLIINSGGDKVTYRSNLVTGLIPFDI